MVKNLSTVPTYFLKYGSTEKENFYRPTSMKNVMILH